MNFHEFSGLKKKEKCQIVKIFMKNFPRLGGKMCGLRMFPMF